MLSRIKKARLMVTVILLFIMIIPFQNCEPPEKMVVDSEVRSQWEMESSSQEQVSLELQKKGYQPGPLVNSKHVCQLTQRLSEQTFDQYVTNSLLINGHTDYMRWLGSPDLTFELVYEDGTGQVSRLVLSSQYLDNTGNINIPIGAPLPRSLRYYFQLVDNRTNERLCASSQVEVRSFSQARCSLSILSPLPRPYESSVMVQVNHNLNLRGGYHAISYKTTFTHLDANNTRQHLAPGPFSNSALSFGLGENTGRIQMEIELVQISEDANSNKTETRICKTLPSTFRVLNQLETSKLYVQSPSQGSGSSGSTGGSGSSGSSGSGTGSSGGGSSSGNGPVFSCGPRHLTINCQATELSCGGAAPYQYESSNTTFPKVKFIFPAMDVADLQGQNLMDKVKPEDPKIKVLSLGGHFMCIFDPTGNGWQQIRPLTGCQVEIDKRPNGRCDNSGAVNHGA